MTFVKNKVEHFVTLFDNNFLPMGMALHHSLMQHAQPFRLWIVCMDKLVEKNITILSLPFVTLIPLRDIETDKLLKVKEKRSKGEYCWTLTPFTHQAVFDRDGTIERVTYLDADLFFFDSPQILLDEFSASEKDVLITEHRFDPEYDLSESSGKFCVQFLTFRNTQASRKVWKWWQDRCIEWCYARIEEGKFGDQKYLDVWPDLFGSEVHILTQKQKTMAPWNQLSIEKENGANLTPVFYHFHGTRIVSSNKILLYMGYKISKSGREIYKEYIYVINEIANLLHSKNITFPYLPEKINFLRVFFRQFIKRVAHYEKIK